MVYISSKNAIKISKREPRIAVLARLGEALRRSLANGCHTWHAQPCYAKSATGNVPFSYRIYLAICRRLFYDKILAKLHLK